VVQVGEIEQAGARVGVAGVVEPDGVIPAVEGGPDGEGAGVVAAGVDVTGSGTAVAAKGDGVAQVRRLGAGVQVGGVDSHAERLVAVVLRHGVVAEGAGVEEQREAVAERVRRCPWWVQLIRPYPSGCDTAPRHHQHPGVRVTLAQNRVMVSGGGGVHTATGTRVSSMGRPRPGRMS